MKKMILVITVLAVGFALRAQVTVAYTGKPVPSNNTYFVSEPISTSFQTVYPGPTRTVPQPMNGWLYSSYKEENNRIVYFYYSSESYYLSKDKDVNYRVILPVMNSYVPETVIATAIKNFGATLYSITPTRATNGELVYQVGLLENGVTRTQLMNPENTVLTSADKMRAGDMKDKPND